MQKSLLKLLGATVALMLSATVSAVGMGGINVASALGQPLKADIELVAISKAEKDSLVARLASPEAYKSSGVEYPYGNKFKFQIENRADGQPYIKVTSTQPVNDPFVSLLVELNWSSGKLSREYTFLLDPPGYVPEQPAQAVVQPVASAVEPAVSGVSAVPTAAVVTPLAPAAPVAVVSLAPAAIPTSAVPVVSPETTAASGEPAAPVAAATPTALVAGASGVPGVTDEFAAASSVPAAATEVAAVSSVPAAATEAATKPVEQAAATPANPELLTVQRGDTMYKIAAQTKLTEVSLERMLVALYRANADQFDGRNMNRIRVGKILRMPSQQELSNVQQSDAVKEIHAQAADWNTYRQKLAGAASVSNQSEAAQQIASGKISSSIADMAPVAKESAKEVLKLSKGEAPGDQVGTDGGGKSMSELDKKNAAQEEAIAKGKALKEEQERIALLEKNLQDMQRLAQLKAAAAELSQPASAVAKTAASEVTATTAVKPTPVAQPKPKQAKPEPSLLDQILDEPLYLAGGAVALLVLGGLGFMLYRRKKKPFDEEDIDDFTEDAGEVTGRMAAPVVPSPDTGDFTKVAVAQVVAAPQSDNVDPISEADLFLNFGRDVQAEEILKEALQNTPGNHQIHLKLLGIYANRKDANSYSAIARLLQDSGDADAWQQAVVMGRKLEPNNPMYGGTGPVEDMGSATMQIPAFKATSEPEPVQKSQASALDFDFGAPAAHEVPSQEQDFLSGAETTSVLTPDGRLAAQAAEMDFDVTSSHASMSADASKDESMDFDITSTHPSMGAAGEPIEAATSMADDLVFDVTGSHSFTPPAAQPEISKPADDGGGMEFTLDFPVENKAAKSAPVVPQSASAGLAGISLNFDDVSASAGSTAGSKDDRWQEVATKLDLAKAYHEMGDAGGAREILEEVLREGDAGQREAAQALVDLLG